MDLFNKKKVYDLEIQMKILKTANKDLIRGYENKCEEAREYKQKYLDATKDCRSCGYFKETIKLNPDKTVIKEIRCNKADCKIKDTKPCELYSRNAPPISYNL